MKTTVFVSAIAAAAIGAFAAGDLALAAKGGIQGPPPGKGGGKKPPVELSNNLSFPAVSESIAAVSPIWDPPDAPLLGVHYSYGCDKPETYDIYSYPNTSCVDNLGSPTTYYTAAECTDATMPSPCQGYPVERVYWQKVDANNWWADSALGTPRTAAYIDWSDNIESNTWSERSVIRLETQPYGSLLLTAAGTFDPFDPATETCEDAADRLGLVAAAVCKTGFQMWHVSGQGISEQWGVRADDATSDPYIYSSPFQIIQTNNARLNIAKLAPESSTCPQPGETTDFDPPPPAENFQWDPINKKWVGATEAIEDPCTYANLPYTTELNVGGKYTYGYNLPMQNVELESLCGSDWLKTGYWRLTFHTNGAVVFDQTNEVRAKTAPPAVPAAPGTVSILAEEEDPDEEPMYAPEVDYINNITYIDICIEPRTQGGGGGGPRR